MERTIGSNRLIDGLKIDNLPDDTQAELDLKQDILAEGPFIDGDKTKLDGIEAGAEVNEVNEAPQDGKQYGRKNGSWSVLTNIGDMEKSVYDPTLIEGDAFFRGNHYGASSHLKLTEVTDPIVDEAVATSVIDANDGIVIVTTTTGNNQTLQSPTDTTAGKTYLIVNKNSSTDKININGKDIYPSEKILFVWDGTSWVLDTVIPTVSNTSDIEMSISGQDITSTLTTTGVTPGTYKQANVRVDSKGRVTTIEDGRTSVMKMATITDPATDAAVTTALIDANNGIVVTTTTTSNEQTLQSPTDTTAGKEYLIVNKSTSSDIIYVNNETIQPGDSLMFYWDGAEWTTDMLHNPNALQLSTGLVYGGEVTINGVDNSKFDISEGLGIVVDHTNGGKPKITQFSISARSSVTITNIATANLTYLSVDENDTLIQSTVEQTPTERREAVKLGIIAHPDRVSILSVDNSTTSTTDVGMSLWELSDAIGFINIGSGNTFGPNGANLSFNKSAGGAVKIDAFAKDQLDNKNTATNPVLTAPIYLPIWQDGLGFFTSGGLTNTITPGRYDDGTGGVGVPNGLVSNNKYQVFRIFFFPVTNTISVQYGQETYSSIPEAESSIFTEPFNTFPFTNQLFRCWLIVKGNATDLSDSGQAKFVTAGNIQGNATGGGFTTSTTNLQQAYINSVQPQIIIDAINQALQIKGGTGVNTDKIQEWLNNAGSITASIDGNGLGDFSDISKGGVNVSSDTETSTFTNKTINLGNNTISGTISQFNTALSDGNFATLAGSEQLTNKQFGDNLDMNSNKIINLTTPTSLNDAVNKGYVDNLIAGVSWKNPCLVATTGNITLSGEQTIDGVLTSSSRVLVKDQTDQTQNGIYVSSSGAWTRASDADSGDEISGLAVNILQGTANADTMFVNTNETITIGVTNITIVNMGSSIAHNNTTGLQGGTSSQYYHLTSQQHTDVTSITTAEYAQLANINTTTISATQWGYLGGMNQGVATTDSVTFSGITSDNADIVARNTGDTKGVILSKEGGIEIYRDIGNSYIDFKTSTAEDYDCRIKENANGLDFHLGGNGSAVSRFYMKSNGDLQLLGQNATITNDGEYIRTNSALGQVNIDARGAIVMNIDTNNNSTQAVGFSVRADGNATDLFYVREDGKIGNFSTPVTDLHIRGTSTSAIRVETTGVDSVPTLSIVNDAKSWSVQVRGDSNDNFTIRDETLATTRFVIDNAGNVGVKTTRPGEDLNGGTSDVSGDLLHIKGGNANLIVEGSTRGQILLSDTGATANSRMFGIKSESSVLKTYSLNDNLTVKNDSIFVLNSNGSVSLGTDFTIYQYEIRKDSNSETGMALKNRATVSSGTIQSIFFEGYRDVETTYRVAKISAEHKAGSAGDLNHGADLVFYTQPGNADAALAERVRITQYGLSGFGGTPIDKVHIFSSVAGEGLTVQGDATLGPEITLRSTDTGGRSYKFLSSGSADTGGAGKFHLIDETASSIRMTVSTVGIGIGTIYPTVPFHTYRNSTIGDWGSNTLTNATTAIQDGFATLYIDGNSIITDSGGFNIGLKNSGYFSIGTNDTRRLKIDGSGNIGFNIDPLVLYHFNHTGDNREAIRIGDQSTATSITGIYLRSTVEAAISYGSGSKLSFYKNGPSSGVEIAKFDANGNFGVTNGSIPITGTLKACLTAQDGNTFSLSVGATVASTAITDATRKFARIGMPHYTNSEELVCLITGDSDGTDNYVMVGGGTTAGNAATIIDFYTAANTTTVKGSIAGRFDNDKFGVGTGTGTITGTIEAQGTSSVAILSKTTGLDSTPTYSLINDAREFTMQVRGGDGDNFSIRDETSGNTRFVITTSGRHGFNTISPAGVSAHFVGETTTTTESTVIIGDNLNAVTAASRNKLTIGNSNGNSELILGQGASNNVVINWEYNATASSAFSTIGTYGGNNRLSLQYYGGNLSIGNGTGSSKLNITGLPTSSAGLSAGDVWNNSGVLTIV